MAELTMTDHGLPRKVLAKARQLGLHNDCLVSGNVCQECEDNIMLAMDFFYSHLSVAEVIRAIVDDYRADMEED